MHPLALLVAAAACLVGWAVLALAGLLLWRARRLDRVVRWAGLAYLLVAGGWATAGVVQQAGDVVAYRGLPTAFFDFLLLFLIFCLFWPWWLYWQMIGDM